MGDDEQALPISIQSFGSMARWGTTLGVPAQGSAQFCITITTWGKSWVSTRPPGVTGEFKAQAWAAAQTFKRDKHPRTTRWAVGSFPPITRRLRGGCRFWS